MDNIVQFPKKHTQYPQLTQEHVVYLVEMGESLVSQCGFLENRIKTLESMSLWDRIFNWPY